MEAKIVLGLGYGDEGKGITVDNLCKAAEHPLVIRFSGGQQCGHTVFHNEDVMHIHNSYGSGALRGVPTYVSEDCTMYLNRIATESAILTDKVGLKPRLMIDGLAKVTTPFDVVFNRMREKSKPHGTTGWGLGSTMHRHLTSGYKINVVDFLNQEVFGQKLIAIERYYLSRLSEYSLNKTEFLDACAEELEVFGENFEVWKHLFEVSNLPKLHKDTTLIFEGSQGIMLDMDHGIYPNITYSSTTSKNALRMCEFLPVKPEIYYVTRCYYSRHGRGWMPDSVPLSLVNNECEVNIQDAWQGEFKCREIQPELLAYAMQIDNLYSYNCKKNLVITCLDQRPNFDVNKLIDQLPAMYSYYTTSSPITKGLQSIGLVIA